MEFLLQISEVYYQGYRMHFHTVIYFPHSLFHCFWYNYYHRYYYFSSYHCCFLLLPLPLLLRLFIFSFFFFFSSCLPKSFTLFPHSFIICSSSHSPFLSFVSLPGVCVWSACAACVCVYVCWNFTRVFNPLTPKAMCARCPRIPDQKKVWALCFLLSRKKRNAVLTYNK